MSIEHQTNLCMLKKKTKTILMFSEIVGTKDYRKPEWVSHMEEMQEALRGMLNLIFFHSKYIYYKSNSCLALYTRSEIIKYNDMSSKFNYNNKCVFGAFKNFLHKPSFLNLSTPIILLCLY